MKAAVGIIIGGLTVVGAMAEQSTLSPEQTQFFENKIRPVLVESCYECHSMESKKLKGGFLIDSKAGWMKGGDSGEVIVPGDAGSSLLVRMIQHHPDAEAMPPKSKLKPEQIQDIIQWIDEGAFDPRDEPLKAHEGVEIFNLEERAKWWSLQPVKKASPPVVKQVDWPRDDVDRFILAELEKRGWSPARPAEKAQLLRRLSFDLIGLAPTREEMNSFLQDESPDAYSKQVDRLLASPHYGEKWARHWMDVVRFGETKAFEFDYTMPYAHRYRDYLIRVFNEDVSYKQFVLESFAGDLLPEPRISEDGSRNESVSGPGFTFLTVGQHGPPDLHDDEVRVYNDVIDTTSKAFMGFTVACARCHDHKFDAITAGDFYSWYGMFRSSRIDIANSVSEELQRAKRDELAAAEPAVRELALKDAARDVEQLSAFMEALSGITQQPAYTNAVSAHERDVQRNKKKKNKKAGEEAPGKSFEEWISPYVEKFAASHAVDNTTLESWVHYRAKAELHQQWPQLEPLFRTLRQEEAGEGGRVKKKLEPLNTPYPTDLSTWIRSGPAFDRTDSESVRFKFSAVNEHQALNAIVASSNPSAGLLSSRVTGAIRSPDFILDGSPVQLYARGSQATVRLIIRSYEMAGNGPTTKGLQFEVNQPGWKRLSFDTKLWKGEPAYLEVIQGGRATGVHKGTRRAPHRISEDAFVSICTELSDWQAVWTTGSPAEVIEGLMQKAVANRLSVAEAEVLSALFEAGLLRAGPDRNPALRKQVGQFASLGKTLPEPHFVRSLTEGTPQDVPIYIRGSHKNLSKDANPRRYMDVFGGERLPEDRSGRLEFAKHLVADDNPLTSRVMVNRVWHSLFGQGIVSSPDDFGKLGFQPSHPELLDVLAADFVEQGWSVKTLIRKLVLSATYQMGTTPAVAALEMDPDNVFLQRMPVKRLEAEQIRDHILMCSGTLDLTQFGPSVKAYVKDLPVARGKPPTGPLDGDGRRSVYLEIRRSFLDSFMSIFGQPNATEATGKRNITNVPGQALALMNSPFAHQQARVWAGRLLAGLSDVDARIQQMHWAAFGRAATEAEVEWCHQILDEVATLQNLEGEARLQDPGPWTELCHVIINRKEFIYLF